MAPKRWRLIRRRKTIGYTQETLADRLRVERSTVRRWESGESEPQPWARPEIAKALQLSPEQLDALLNEPDGKTTAARIHEAHDELGQAVVHLSHHPDLPETDDMNRRALLRLFSVAGTLMAIKPELDVDRLAHAAERASRLDLATLDEYAQLNSNLWRVFTLAPSKGQVLPLVRNQLGVLTDKLGEARDEIERQRLCVLAADLFQLAGEIFFDGDRYTDAAHCYTLAASAGKVASAFDLWACALTRHAFVSVYERQFREATPMLELAATLARRGDSALSTRHWVAAVQAETFAGLGDLAACQRALDTAEQVRALPGQVHNGGWLRFDGSRLAEERGTCYVGLGRLDLAEAALTDALAGSLTVRRRASVLTDLAVIGAQRGDPDQVVTFADAAWKAARDTGSGVIGRKLRTLQPHLEPLLYDKKVNQLNNKIAALHGRATIGL